MLHAPGSLCTYEPQMASDVYAMFQSVLHGGQTVPVELLWKDSPPEKFGDFDYLMELIDWDINVAADFREKRFMAPVPAVPGTAPDGAKQDAGFYEEWICYKCKEASAKRLTLAPGAEATIRDEAPYGLICLQGRGEINGLPLESPTLIRFGQETYDEYFVPAGAASAGVKFRNGSKEDLVILKHFALNPELDRLGL